MNRNILRSTGGILGVLLCLLVMVVGGSPSVQAAQEADAPALSDLTLDLDFQGIPIQCTPRNEQGGEAWLRRTTTPYLNTYATIVTGCYGSAHLGSLLYSFPDTLRIRVKTIYHLASCLQVGIPSNGTTVIMPEMRGGDATGNNLVDTFDFLILKNGFGCVAGHPCYIDSSDFDRDGVTDTVDFIILRSNFGEQGCLPLWGPEEGAVETVGTPVEGDVNWNSKPVGSQVAPVIPPVSTDDPATTYTLTVQADWRVLDGTFGVAPAYMAITDTDLGVRVFDRLVLGTNNYAASGLAGDGPYQVYLDGQWALGTYNTTASNTISMGVQYGGDSPVVYTDANGNKHWGQGDNVVNIDDYNLFMAWYGDPQPASGTDDWWNWYRVNYNLDDSVDIADYNILYSGYGRSGAPCSPCPPHAP